MQPDEERGRRLASRRNELGLSQREIAKKIGVHRNSVVGWEKGIRVPQRRHAAAVVKAYKLPEDFFFSSLSDFEKRLGAEVAEMKAQLDKVLAQVSQNGELIEAANEAADSLDESRAADEA